MDRKKAVEIISQVAKKKYGTHLAASEALGMQQSNFSRAINSDCRPIPKQMLEMAGLVAVQPPVFYERVKCVEFERELKT